MQLGMIGLGRMGGNMTKRLAQRGHDMKTYDPGVESTASSIAELRDQLDAPRAFWMMVPAGKITEETFEELLRVAEPGDTIVDGGNSNFRDSQRRHAHAAEHSIHFVDVGVSGGVWGLEAGYCLMAGGADEPVQRLEPVFTALAPEDGYAHVGPSGAGHFVKMIDDGIEYCLMLAYAGGPRCALRALRVTSGRIVRGQGHCGASQSIRRASHSRGKVIAVESNPLLEGLQIRRRPEP